MSPRYLSKTCQSDVGQVEHESRCPRRLSSLRLKAPPTTEVTNFGSKDVDKQTPLAEFEEIDGDPKIPREEQQQQILVRILLRIFEGDLSKEVKELVDRGRAAATHRKKQRKARKEIQTDDEWLEQQLGSTKYLLEMVQKKRGLLAKASGKDVRSLESFVGKDGEARGMNSGTGGSAETILEETQ